MSERTALGDAIRARRELMNLRQEDIERRTNGLVSQTALSKIELGKTKRPNGETVALIATALETTSDALWAVATPPAIADEMEPPPMNLAARVVALLDEVDLHRRATLALLAHVELPLAERQRIQELLAPRRSA